MGLFTKNKTKKPENADSKADKESAKLKSGSKETSSPKAMKNLYKETASPSKTKKADKEILKISKNAYRILLKPLITEKATRLTEDNKYCFEVSPSANKIEVAKAVSDVYGVSPRTVNIINVTGKRVRRGRSVGKRKDWKKAIVALPKGKTIEIYEGI